MDIFQSWLIIGSQKACIKNTIYNDSDWLLSHAARLILAFDKKLHFLNLITLFIKLKLTKVAIMEQKD